MAPQKNRGIDSIGKNGFVFSFFFGKNSACLRRPPKNRRIDFVELIGFRSFTFFFTKECQAATAFSPLIVRPSAPAEIRTVSPSLTRPSRIIDARLSCKDRWITRLRGRAP